MRKSAEREESFVLRVLKGVFIGAPLACANGIIRFGAHPGRLKQAWPAFVFLAVLFLAGLKFRWAGLVFEIFTGLGAYDPVWKLALRFAGFYAVYLVVSLPVFLLIARLESNLFKKRNVKREPGILRMRRDRLRSDFNRSYLGQSFYTGEPVYLANEQRLMHTEVVGSTGTGKTDSVLLSLLAHDIANGKGAVVIDGKGDRELYERIRYIVNKKGRAADFFNFSLAHTGKSNTYNPLLHGNATELKDKIVGSMTWTEDFYRRMAEEASLALLNVLKAPKDRARENKPILFSDLHSYLTNYDALSHLANQTENPVWKEDLGKMVKRFKDNPKFLSGLMADLYLTARSEFSKLVDVERPDIDLLRVYEKNQIVYFQLNLQGYGDTAKRMGRIILQDIRAVSSHIQANIADGKRHFFPVFVDDASSFLDLNFIDFLNKARAAGFAITLLHQSLGDLVIRRDFSFQQQVIENTNIKIILRQDDPQSVEKLSKIGGTCTTMIPTYQTEEKLIGKGFTGVGSIREGQAFRIDPDLIRALRRGEAILIWKSPSFQTDYVKLDYFGYAAYQGEVKLNKCDDSLERKEEANPTDCDAPTAERSNAAKNGIQIDVEKQGEVKPETKQEKDPLDRIKEAEKAKQQRNK